MNYQILDENGTQLVADAQIIGGAVSGDRIVIEGLGTYVVLFRRHGVGFGVRPQLICRKHY